MAIAMLPLSAGFTGVASAEPSGLFTAQAPSNCDHHQPQHGAPSGQTQKDIDHTTCPAGCGLCVVVVATDGPRITYSVPASTALKPRHLGDALASLMGSTPFRPPRS